MDNNLKYKLIIADFDDTVVDDKLLLSKRLKNAIDLYRSRGGIFTFATGRVTSSILPYAKELALDGYLISFQGSVVSNINEENIYYKKPIQSSVAYKITKYLEDNSLYFHTYVDDHYLIDKATDYSYKYNQFTSCTMKEIKTNISEYIMEKVLDPIKLMIIDQAENTANIIKEIQDKFGELVYVTNSKPNFIEIIDKDVNKGVGVKYVADSLGINKENVICIGDSGNDVAMLEYAGFAVAVENASNSAKDIADFICPSCSNDGVAYTIERFGLS